MIDSTIFTEKLRRRTLRSLRKICGSRRVLPRSHHFPGRLFKTGPLPLAEGGSADVWQVRDDRRNLYAAKVFRLNEWEDRRIKVGPPSVNYGYETHFPTRGIIRRSHCGSGWTTPMLSRLLAQVSTSQSCAYYLRGCRGETSCSTSASSPRPTVCRL